MVLYLRIPWRAVLPTEPVNSELIAGHTGSGTQSLQDVFLNVDILLFFVKRFWKCLFPAVLELNLGQFLQAR